MITLKLLGGGASGQCARVNLSAPDGGAAVCNRTGDIILRVQFSHFIDVYRCIDVMAGEAVFVRRIYGSGWSDVEQAAFMFLGSLNIKEAQ